MLKGFNAEEAQEKCFKNVTTIYATKVKQVKRFTFVNGNSQSCWIDLHQLAVGPTGPLTHVLIGDAQPNRRLVGPYRAAPCI